MKIHIRQMEKLHNHMGDVVAQWSGQWTADQKEVTLLGL